MISIILPTRQRPEYLLDFLHSIQRTASRPENLEIVLVRDSDDLTSSPEVRGLLIREIIGPPGRTMGQLNQAGLFACTGEWVFLLNDDVLMKTAGWDSRLSWACSRYKDGICLIHVNDTLLRERLCVFPFVSRSLALKYNLIEPCYERYRIDDHIEDIFLRLAALGENRIQYLPDIIVEHRNITWVNGVPEYHAEQHFLVKDAEKYNRLAANRQIVATNIFREIRQQDTDERINRIDYAIQVTRNSAIHTVYGFSSIHELNHKIESSLSDFIWLPRSLKDKCPFTQPPEFDYLQLDTGIYLDKRKFSPPIFDARFKAFFFDLDLCIRYGLPAGTKTCSWWFKETAEAYFEDLSLFRSLHPSFYVEKSPPHRMSLARKVWNRWRMSGLNGLISSILNVVGQVVALCWFRNSPGKALKEQKKSHPINPV